MVVLIKGPAALSRSTFSQAQIVPPLGLAYLCSRLKQEGLQVKVIDGFGEKIEQFHKISNLDVLVQGLSVSEIIERIPLEADAIGLSCMFSNEWFLHDPLIRKIHKKFPRVPIIVGGEHVTAEWKNILLTCADVDFCVIGEGEDTLAELVKCLKEGKDPANVAGIAFLKDGEPFKTAQRERKKHIDEFPWPDWEQIPIHNYHRLGYSVTTLNRKSMPILASRGCPFRCTFCTSPQMWGTSLSLRSPDDIVAEIKSHVNKYGVEHIDFTDLVGVINPRWAEELLTLLIKENLPVTWLLSAGTRSEILDEKMLRLFRDSKVLRIYYAPETGSKKTVGLINKRVDLDKIVESIKTANRLGISTRASLIYGFPGQTRAQAWENILFGMKLSVLGVYDVNINFFSAHPGSQIHRELVESGKIDMPKLIKEGKYLEFLRNENHTKFLDHHSWSDAIPGWTSPWILFGTMFVNYLIQYTLRPWRLFQSLHRTVVKKKPLTFSDHILYRIFFGPKYRIKYQDLPESDYLDAVENNFPRTPFLRNEKSAV